MKCQTIAELQRKLNKLEKIKESRKWLNKPGYHSFASVIVESDGDIKISDCTRSIALATSISAPYISYNSIISLKQWRKDSNNSLHKLRILREEIERIETHHKKTIATIEKYAKDNMKMLKEKQIETLSKISED